MRHAADRYWSVAAAVAAHRACCCVAASCAARLRLRQSRVARVRLLPPLLCQGQDCPPLQPLPGVALPVDAVAGEAPLQLQLQAAAAGLTARRCGVGYWCGSKRG